MDADEVLRPSVGVGQRGDRQRGRVGGVDDVGAGPLLHQLGDGVLGTALLEHRLVMLLGGADDLFRLLALRDVDL